MLAFLAVALGLYLYLGGLDRLPMQRGNEPMYAALPIWMLEGAVQSGCIWIQVLACDLPRLLERMAKGSR